MNLFPTLTLPNLSLSPPVARTGGTTILTLNKDVGITYYLATAIRTNVERDMAGDGEVGITYTLDVEVTGP